MKKIYMEAMGLYKRELEMKLAKKLIFLVVCMCIVLSLSFAASASYLHTSDNQILDAHGNKASLSGLSWFGFETNNYSPHGLWAHSMNFYLDIVKIMVSIIYGSRIAARCLNSYSNQKGNSNVSIFLKSEEK